MNIPILDAAERTQERFSRGQERAIKNFGFGDTDAALALSETLLPRLTAIITEAVKRSVPKNDRLNPLMPLLAEVSAETVALCTLQIAFDQIAREEKMITTCATLGIALNNELWAAGLVTHDKNLAQYVDRVVRKKHGALKYRQQAARALAKRGLEKKGIQGYSRKCRWTRTECVIAGNWLLDLCLDQLQDVFTIYYQEGTPYLTITDEANEQALKACDAVMRRNPAFAPQVEPPQSWNGFQSGGPTDRRKQGVRVQILRSSQRKTAFAIRQAIASGQMQPALDALNAVQATPWRINSRVLEVQLHARLVGIDIPGFPRADYPRPEKPREWEFLTKQERTLWKLKAEGVKRANHTLVGDRLSFTRDTAIARELEKHERFWTSCNLDWRGRVYAMPHFNFQREDRVRALFLFADGEPLGHEGLYWLKVHVANCGDFNKISKRTFMERVQWTNENATKIAEAATDPLTPSSLSWWTQADKPWLFLAACMELHAASMSPTTENYVSALPVNWDGTCSGLQHLCAMTRAPEGEFVNLTDTKLPQDVYQRVADACAIQMLEDVEDGNTYARMALDFGVDRKFVKRNVMTYSYSSKQYGMAEQLKTDLMKPLKTKVETGELEEHPFGDDYGAAASRYLAGRIYQSIEQIVTLPAQAMAFLQQLARIAADANKPLRWVTPVGLPWANCYHEPHTARVRLWLHDNGARVKWTAKVATGTSNEAKIDRIRAANGVAPNFVHANDGAHLMLVVNDAYREGFRHFALVHDSFGCLASRAGRFHRIIREQFVAMYEQHDVLAEVREQLQQELPEAELPPVPQYGTLNIKDVLNASYAFA